MSVPYKLYNADCREVIPTLHGISAVITDPPYGIDLSNHGAFVGDFSVIGDKDLEIANYVIEWCSKEKLNTAMFCSPDKPYEGKWNSRLVWYKRGRGVGGDWERCWLRDWEMILVNAVKPIKKKETSVLDFSPASCEFHKCEKPVSLMSYLIQQLSNEGDIIFDPFMGSGSTGVAALQTGRMFIGCELSPEYFAIAEKRIKQAALQPSFFHVAQHSVQRTGGESGQQSLFSAGEVLPAKVTRQSTRR